MDGFINFNKDPGITSNKALDVIKRISREKKAGFLGTLDPIASGVLPVGLGWGTRLFPYFEKTPKTYRATIIFGAETDTQDSSGKVVREASAGHLTRELIESLLPRFRGEIEQIPPMFSAKRVDGERLYRIARKGGEVERQPKKVTVHSLELEDFSGGSAALVATVSRGTYIRTLCEDLGRAAGSAAHMGALARTASHTFLIGNAWTLARLDERREHPAEWLLPLDFPVLSFPRHTVGERDLRQLLNGQPVNPPPGGEGQYRIYLENGSFAGMGTIDRYTKKLTPEKLIPPARPRRFGPA